jgi:CDP-glycerol glycerophosphotransferase (TagB/SpsB family)
VRNKPNLFLIIRVHPREFPNKREDVKSEHAEILECFFKNLPENVRVNWPKDNISIYDLAQETDVFLNAWSSVGVEMSLLGIPVVIYSKDLVLYPHQLNYLGKNRKGYFTKIELALKQGWNYKKIKMSYRWLGLYYYRTILRIRAKRSESKQSLARTVAVGLWNRFYGVFPPKARALLIKVYTSTLGSGNEKKLEDDCRKMLLEHIDISRVEQMLSKSENTLVDVEKILKEQVSENEEDKNIRSEIARIYEALYGSKLKNINIKEGSLQYNLWKIFN